MSVALAVEAVVVGALLLVLRKCPKVGACLALGLSIGIAMLLRAWARGPFAAVEGSLVAGRSTMRGVVFGGEGKHGVQFMPALPLPDHTENQMLVQVRAAGLNPSNFKLVMNKIPFLRHVKQQHVVGYDVAGTVVSLGTDSDCSGFNVGDRIYGFAHQGSLAEYTVSYCSAVGHMPKSLDFKQAAGLPVVAITSLNAFERAGLREGQDVLVIGASGGCGVLGVGIANAIGANVAGICSSRNWEYVRDLGVDEKQIYRYNVATDMAKLEQNGQQFDVIYDTVTSFAPEDPNYEPSMAPLLKPGGKYKAINGAPLDWMRCLLDDMIARPLGFNVQRPGYDLFLAKPSTAGYERIAQWFDQGKLTAAPLDSTFSLDEVDKAFDRIKSRRTRGKIVFDIA